MAPAARWHRVASTASKALVGHDVIAFRLDGLRSHGRSARWCLARADGRAPDREHREEAGLRFRRALRLPERWRGTVAPTFVAVEPAGAARARLQSRLQPPGRSPVELRDETSSVALPVGPFRKTRLTSGSTGDDVMHAKFDVVAEGIRRRIETPDLRVERQVSRHRAN